MTRAFVESEAVLHADPMGRERAFAREEAGREATSYSARRGSMQVRAGAVSAITVVALLGLWTLAAHLRLVSPLFLPAPGDVLWQAVTLLRDGYMDSTLAQHAATSLGRFLAALAATLVVGVPVGLAMGLTTIGKGIFDPIIEFIRPIPPLAYLPLVIIWLGIGESAKVLVIAIAMLAPITIATLSGVRSVAPERINAARSMGANRRQVIRFVIVPSALPSILTGVRIALGAGWSTLVAAELVAATRGLGFMIQSAAAFLVTDVVVLGIIIIALIAVAMELAIRFLERLLVPWSVAGS